jgi:hypothetical protein
VLIKVYVEKSKKKRSSSSSIQQHHHHYHHHHYHIHHTVTQEEVHGSGSNNSNKGYDRRSRLLMYSRILRNSARGGASPMPLLPNYSENNNIQIPKQVVLHMRLNMSRLSWARNGKANMCPKGWFKKGNVLL